MNNCGSNKFCSESGQFVEVTGLCNPEDVKDMTEFNAWTQISVQNVFEIPEQKPDIEELNFENVNVQILKQKVIVTPAGEAAPTPAPVANLQGKILTGRKLVIEGLICKSITFTAFTLDGSQPIHSVQTSIPFSAFIILPLTINCIDVLELDFKVIPCIEDVFIKQISDRKIFENITLLLQAVVKQGRICEEKDCRDFEGICIKGIATREQLEAVVLSNSPPNNLWTQFVIAETFKLPSGKPDIEQIDCLFSHVEIISQRVVRTPRSCIPNLEGNRLTGKKLIIEGVLKQKVAYTAEVECGSQPLHSVHFDVPFSAFIVIPVTSTGSSVFRIEPFIEDIFICSTDRRQIFKNTIIFIKATPCVY